MSLSCILGCDYLQEFKKYLKDRYLSPLRKGTLKLTMINVSVLGGVGRYTVLAEELTSGTANCKSLVHFLFKKD